MENLTLDSLESTTAYLTEDQFGQLNENYDKIKTTMTEFQFNITMLDTKLQLLYLDPQIKKIDEKKKRKQNKFLENHDV
jgi:hypothetical protein